VTGGAADEGSGSPAESASIPGEGAVNEVEIEGGAETGGTEDGADRGGDSTGAGGTDAAPTAGGTYGSGTGEDTDGTNVAGWPSADGRPSESDPAALAASISRVEAGGAGEVGEAEDVDGEGDAGSTRSGADATDGCRPSEPRCSDSAKSCALRCRAAGSFAIAVRSSATSHGGTSARVIGGRSSCSTRSRNAYMSIIGCCGSTKGGWPISRVHIVEARLYTSEMPDWAWCSNASGEAWCGVISSRVRVLPSSSGARAMPKSVSAGPKRDRRMLDGLTSRWTMPTWWAACSASPILTPTSRTSSSGSGPFWRRIPAYEPPSQYSITMYGRSSSVTPVSMMDTMCGWLESATVVASSRAALTGIDPVSTVITLIATGRLRVVWMARKTSAVVPCAMSSGLSYPGSAGSSGAFTFGLSPRGVSLMDAPPRSYGSWNLNRHGGRRTPWREA
jgi:hypothetical protein